MGKIGIISAKAFKEGLRKSVRNYGSIISYPELKLLPKNKVCKKEDIGPLGFKIAKDQFKKFEKDPTFYLFPSHNLDLFSNRNCLPVSPENNKKNELPTSLRQGEFLWIKENAKKKVTLMKMINSPEDPYHLISFFKRGVINDFANGFCEKFKVKQASLPYVLGMKKSYPYAIEAYETIVSLNQNNFFVDKEGDVRVPTLVFDSFRGPIAHLMKMEKVATLETFYLAVEE